MNIYTLINIISNCTIAFSACALLIHIFGDPDNAIWDNRIKAWLAKFGLTVVTCGAVLNILSLSTPNKTETLLSVGMSLTFFWLSWWQWEQFKKIKAAATSKTKEVKPKTPHIKKVKLATPEAITETVVVNKPTKKRTKKIIEK